MKYCKQCNVSVNNPTERCPLCYNPLSQLDSRSEYPSYPDLLEKAEKYNFIYRILLMFSIAASVICFTINLLTLNESGYLWSLLVIVDIAYMWVAVGTAVRRHSKLGFNIMIQVISLSALCVAIDLLTGYHNWALNYVVPFLFISATMSITVLIIIRRMLLSSFILYFILTALLGFIPIILLALRLVTEVWPSLVSALYSGLSLISIFIFANNATKVELKKRFHV